MDAKVPQGTPTRAGKYQQPARRRSAFGVSAAIAAILVVLLSALYVAGFRRTLSPGDVASAHAPLDLRCMQCHQEGKDVMDVRCERCHDAAVTDRLSNAAHVLFGSSDVRKADRADPLACVKCHTDHQGRAHVMARVEDRECATCHAFSALKRHPEFAAVRAQATAGAGIRFTHDRHVAEVRAKSGSDCRYCHQPTADATGFEPIVFDRHCASCHTENGAVTGDTDPLPAAEIVLPAAITPPLLSVPQIRDAPRQQKVASGFRHRDPWVLLNLARLRRAIVPDDVAAERAILMTQVSTLDQQLKVRPLSAIDRTQLTSTIAVLQQNLEGIDRRLALQQSAGSDDRALQALVAVTKSLANDLAPVNGDLTAAAQAVKTVPVPLGPPKIPVDSAARAQFDARRSELVAVLTAIEKRGTSTLATRAQALRRRVEQLSFDDTSGRAPDIGALQRRLDNLDQVFRVVASIPDPSVQFQLAQTDILRQLARQQVGGGLSPDEFEARRDEISEVLRQIERRGDETQRLRAAALRQRLAALQPGGQGSDALRRERRRLARFIERLRLEVELDAAGERIAPIPVDAGPARADAEAALAQTRQRLADLDRGPRRPVALTAEERVKLSTIVDSLLVPCTKCHDLSGARLAPVRIARSVFVRARFDHAPHIKQTSCETCHAMARTSKRAADVLVPGVGNCQTCHGASQASADCETCHRYHPRSFAMLAGMP